MSLPFLRLCRILWPPNELPDVFAELIRSVLFLIQPWLADPKKRGLLMSPLYLPWCVDASLFL